MKVTTREWPALALCVAVCLIIAPLWLVHSPAMPDYPAHVAGFKMLATQGHGEPWEKYYFIHWLFVPNLASELIVPTLAQILPVEAATKLFLSLGMVLWVLGPVLVQRALFGKISPLPLAAAFFVYNAPFLWGFFNFFFAAGCSFVLLAWWIWQAGRLNAVKLAGYAAALLVLYAFHLFAFLTLLLLIGCFEISRAVDAHDIKPVALLRRALPVILVAVPAFAVFFIFKPIGGDAGPLQFNILDTLEDRFAAAIEYYFEGPALILTGLLAGFWLAGILSGFLRVHRLMILPLIVLTLSALLAPEWAMGGWGGHLRLPAVLGALLFATCRPELSEKRLKIMAGLIGVGLLLSVVSLTRDWSDYDRQISGFRADIAGLPKGVRMLTVLDSGAMDEASDQPYWHLAEYAIVDRSGFAPLMFATKGQHIVGVKPPYDKYAAATAEQGSPPDVTELGYLADGRVDLDPDIDTYYPYLKYFQCHFDVAVIVHGEGEDNTPATPPKFMSLLKTGSFYSLYAIHPTKDCPRR
ncbi:MAG: hypothetical protein WCD42_06890 [Rhizomicrobium sp.]